MSAVRRRERDDPEWPKPHFVGGRVLYIEHHLEHWMRTRPVGGGDPPVEALAALAARQQRKQRRKHGS